MMSKKLTHTLCAALAASALAAVPALSAAEGGGGEQGQGKQEGQSQQQITKRMTLNESMTLPLTSGCSYTATINGTVTPTKKQQQKKEEAKGQAQEMASDLRVTASVACPNRATLKVSESVTGAGPLTHEALEKAIERRGTIFMEQEGRHCAFVPDFRLSAQGVQGVGIAFMCTIEAGQGQQQKGG